MAKTIDPAARLMRIIKKFCATSNGMATVGDVWAGVFKIKKEERTRIYSQLAECMDLADSVERTIRANPALPHEKYLSSFESLTRGLSPKNYNEPVQPTTEWFAEPLMTQLDFCSDVMLKETELEPSTIDDIRKSVDELYEALKDCDVSACLRTALQDLAVTMRRALDQYEVRGVKGFKQAFGQMVVELQAHRVEVKATHEKPLWRPLNAVFQKFGKAIEVSANIATLLDSPKVATLLDSTSSFISSIP